jgi:hypothetical protein
MGQLNDASRSKLEALLAVEVKAGNIIQSTFPPSLNKRLNEEGLGSTFVGTVHNVRADAVPNKLSPGKMDTAIELADQNGELCTFYASTAGLKGKVRDVGKGDVLAIAYLGEQKSKNASFRDWKDYGVYRFDGATALANAQAFEVKLKATLK